MELLLNGFKVIKDIRMVKLKVIHYQSSWAVMNKFGTLIKEGAIIFISFNDKEWAIS